MSTKKVNKLIKSGRLQPMCSVIDGSLAIVGYQRKPRSRKSHHRPFMLNNPRILGKIKKQEADQ